MSLTSTEQFTELTKQSGHPLILLPAHPSKEILAAGFGLYHFFRNIGKEPTLGGEGLSLQAQTLSFLSIPENTVDSLSGLRDFVLIFHTTENKILKTRTEEAADEFRIYITPERGSIDPRDFSFVPAKLPFDLAIILGSPDRESLGAIFEESPDIFYEVPVINIDNKSENEQFGQLNIVDVTASSTAEILAGLFEAIDPERFDTAVSEALLAAIMSATESFQRKNTSPQSLLLASKLMERGADRERLVLHLYKTQPLSSIRLWGRVMSNLKWHEDIKLASSFVSLSDFIETRSDQNNLPGILDRIRSNFSSASILLAYFQQHADGEYGAIVKTNGYKKISELIRSKFPNAETFGDTTFFSLNAATPNEAENVILRAISDNTKQAPTS